MRSEFYAAVTLSNEINRSCKDDPTGYRATRREKKEKKETGRQHIRMDRFKVERSPSKG